MRCLNGLRLSVIASAMCLLVPRLGFSQQNEDFSTYVSVKIFVQAPADLHRLQELGITIDHYRGKPGEGIGVVLNLDELRKLQTAAIPHEVVVRDLNKYHLNRPKPTQTELLESQRILNENGITGFGYGSMGGFHTYAEVVRQLDTLHLLYPNLITPRDSIGVTEQGRVVWAVEISDNPGIPEPDEATVYFDALHHAREPISMSVLLYYMWWLLENYGSNPEATYLVNNRRICFIPVVNPDGYVYNQQTNPNGGGMWRKNRRNNGGGLYGVDLNRNYGYMWGYDDIGSSPNPGAETYRGPSAWSEPESRAVRDYVLARNPSIAFSIHSVAGRYLNPYGYRDTVAAYEYYAEYASDFSRFNNYLYGTVYQMLGYYSNGTTRDFLHHDVGCLAWVPEIAGSGFWPLQTEIIPLCQENLLAVKYLTWVSGAFADYQSFRVLGTGAAMRGDSVKFSVTVRNKGLTQPARDVQVSVVSLNANLIPVSTTVLYDSVGVRNAVENANTPFMFAIPPSVPFLSEVRFASTVTQEGVVTSVDTFSVIIGYPRVLFSDDAENGRGNWVGSGNGVPWDTTYVMAHAAVRSFADSRYGNVANSTNNTFTTAQQINLAGTVNPRLEYFARWSNERNYDYVRIQLSTNSGSTWSNLSGRHTTTVGGQPAYTANMGTWAWESINLTSYTGRQILLRFNLISDAGLRGDGFYFDNLRVVDYRDSITTDANVARGMPETFELFQNYPNPFNPATQIRYALPVQSSVKLTVFNILGQEIARLVDEVQAGGYHVVAWDGTNDNDLIVPTGLYFYKLEASGSDGRLFTSIGKMLVMK